MTQLARGETAVGFIERAFGSDLGDEAKARRAALDADATTLGLIGLLASLAVEGEAVADDAVRDELHDALAGDLRDSLGADAPAEADLEALWDRYLEVKGERGVELLTRLVARVTHEVYGLQGHGFLQDDVLAAYDVLAWSTPTSDARETARRLTRISRRSARHVFGHLPEQLEFVHQLGRGEGELPYAEMDRRLDGFAPRIFAARLPSLVRSMIPEESRFRFLFVLWGRLRGLVLPRAGVQGIVEQIEPKRPMQVVERLEARAEARAQLCALESPDALPARITELFRARRIRT